MRPSQLNTFPGASAWHRNPNQSDSVKLFPLHSPQTTSSFASNCVQPGFPWHWRSVNSRCGGANINQKAIGERVVCSERPLFRCEKAVLEALKIHQTMMIMMQYPAVFQQSLNWNQPNVSWHDPSWPEHLKHAYKLNRSSCPFKWRFPSRKHRRAPSWSFFASAPSLCVALQAHGSICSTLGIHCCLAIWRWAIS